MTHLELRGGYIRLSSQICGELTVLIIYDVCSRVASQQYHSTYIFNPIHPRRDIKSQQSSSATGVCLWPQLRPGPWEIHLLQLSVSSSSPRCFWSAPISAPCWCPYEGDFGDSFWWYPQYVFKPTKYLCLNFFNYIVAACDLFLIQVLVWDCVRPVHIKDSAEADVVNALVC